MRRFLWLMLLLPQFVWAQHSIYLKVKDANTLKAIEGVSVYIKDSNFKGTTNDDGVVSFKNIPLKKVNFICSDLNYEEQTITHHFSNDRIVDTVGVFMIPKEEVMDEVIITSTRTNSRIEDSPVKVEVIGQEEVNEEGAIKPMGIAKLLTESGSVLPQQTSSISGNVSIRLLGLDGKYTQLLKDGFPLYSGFAQGLSITQIPPLDLRQIEIIKGSSSSLYGGDAIAGIINLISKVPHEKPELTFLLNKTSLGGEDVNGYYAKKWKKVGFSFLSANSWQSAKDVSHDGFSNLPQTRTFNFSPTLFIYPDNRTSIRFGINGLIDDRKGGDLLVLNHQVDAQHQFFVENKSQRWSSQFLLTHQSKSNALFTFKSSNSYFNRTINQFNAAFGGKQWDSYTEANMRFMKGQHQFVLGSNFITQNFKEDTTKSHLNRDQQYHTFGVFMQDDWKFAPNFIGEGGIRLDFQDQLGAFFLPRLALKYQFNPDFYVRLGSGLGYKLPTIFSTQAEEVGYNAILPLGQNIKAEQSIGTNLDFNYKLNLEDEAYLTLTQSFFDTQIQHPLVLQGDVFTNQNQPINTAGLETDFHFVDDEFQIYGAYTYINAKRKYNTVQPFLPLTPKHKLNVDVLYEVEKNFSVAAEGYYLSSMYRDGDTKTPSFFTLGLSVQKYFGKITMIANLENALDVKQSNREPLVLPPTNDPSFRQIYAPIEGRVFNLALKISL
ncbi:MAG: TonB-dependent receptor [Sphingobacteriales bacterium]|nr:TonB-dependent receptor [Sphingobacteriales bacterium]